jgi:hypothetical protein
VPSSSLEFWRYRGDDVDHAVERTPCATCVASGLIALSLAAVPRTAEACLCRLPTIDLLLPADGEEAIPADARIWIGDGILLVHVLTPVSAFEPVAAHEIVAEAPDPKVEPRSPS